MKRFERTMFLLLTIGATNAIAQNTFPSSGNVGIGTTSPGASLDVYGSTMMNGGFRSKVIGPVTLATAGTIDLGYFRSGNIIDVDVNMQGGCADSAFHYRIAAIAWGLLPVVTKADSADVCNQYLGTNALYWKSDPDNLDFGYLYLQITNPANTSLSLTLKVTADSYFTDATTPHSGFSAIPVAISVAISNSTTAGNVGIGTANPSQKLEVNGNIALTSGSGASITFADGTNQSTAWTGTTCGGDYAESVDVAGDRTRYEPGDILVIDPREEGKFLKSARPYSTFVTGIYSTKPGLVGRRQLTDKSHMKEEVPMAMTGIVPTKVTAENGPIEPGDLLVSSSTLGYAMKGTDRGRMLGAVIGKALGHLDTGTGVVEVVVTLQ